MEDDILSMLSPEEDLTSISAHDPMFVHPLNEENVLDYFSGTKFYDPSCNNQIIKMQCLSKEVLKKMTGIEYVVQGHEAIIDPNTNMPNELWVIRKQYRQSPDQEILISIYYIINQVIYQAPDILSICESRFTKSVSSIYASMLETIKLIEFNKDMCHEWQLSGNDPAKGTLNQARAVEQRHVEQMDRLMRLLDNKIATMESSDHQKS